METKRTFLEKGQFHGKLINVKKSHQAAKEFLNFYQNDVLGSDYIRLPILYQIVEFFVTRARNSKIDISHFAINDTTANDDFGLLRGRRLNCKFSREIDFNLGCPPFNTEILCVHFTDFM